jgi:hypothetical protein
MCFKAIDLPSSPSVSPFQICLAKQRLGELTQVDNRVQHLVRTLPRTLFACAARPHFYCVQLRVGEPAGRPPTRHMLFCAI